MKSENKKGCLGSTQIDGGNTPDHAARAVTKAQFTPLSIDFHTSFSAEVMLPLPPMMSIVSSDRITEVKESRAAFKEEEESGNIGLMKVNARSVHSGLRR
jgi:hypothetical protein